MEEKNLPRLSGEAAAVFKEAVTGPMNPPHRGFPDPHVRYNVAVKSMFFDWVNKSGIDIKNMTAKQASSFVGMVLDSNHPDVKPFLEDIAKRQGVSLKALKDRVRGNAQKGAARFAKSALAKVVATEGAETATKALIKKGGSALLRKNPLVGAGFFIYDWRQGGLGHACNEALWPLSELWRK